MSDYRLAPPGFTREQWATFNEVGLIQYLPHVSLARRKRKVMPEKVSGE